MIAIIKGEFLSQRDGTKKDGTAWISTTILSGDETVTIFDYNPGAAVKRLDPVEVLCEIRRGQDGKQYITPIRK